MAPLGAGGMGEVYRARDPRLQREVAVKVLPEDGTREQLLRLDREARVVGALNHPNIVAVYDVGTQDASPYVVQELLEGETLRDRMSHGPLSPRKAADYAAQIARGLAAAHDRGICHRDIKPDNLFLTREGVVKVLDFGLAKRQPQAASEDANTTPRENGAITETGTILGTVGYMSPEQVRGQPADHRSDIFSLGAVIYEMLTGRRPFRGATPVDTLHAILHDEAPDLLELDPRLPASLAHAVRHCLEKNPDDRFQSARDLAFNLNEIQASASTASASRLPAVRRGGWLKGAALTAAVLAVAGVLYAVAPRRPWWARAPDYQQATFRRGIIHAARFGPEGQTIVYGAAWDGRAPEIWFTLAGSPESRPWGETGSTVLAVSRLGELALLTRHHYAGGERYLGTLARTAMAGGAAREIAEDVQDADWAPDGQTLAVVRAHGPAVPSRLEYPLGHALLEGSDALHDVRVSPDGDLVAVLADASSIGYGGAVTVIDRSGKRRPLTRLWPNARGLAWSPSGDEVWFTAADERGQRALRAVTLSGRERVVATAPGSLTLRDISSSGRVLLTQEAERRGVIALAPGAAGEQEFSWLDRSAMGDLSADGRVLLFGDRFRVYTRRTDGSSPTQIGEGYADALSPDGAEALVTAVRGDRLTILPTGPGDPRPVPPHSIASYAGAHWLPDGKRIVFNGREAGHGVRPYVQALDGSPPRAIAPEGTAAGAVAPDGRWVAATAPDGVWAYPVEDGDARRIAGCQPGERPIVWSADGTSLWVYRREQLPARVFRIELSSGRREPWRTFMPADAAGLVSIPKVDLTPDGRSYAYSYRRILSDLYVVEGLR